MKPIAFRIRNFRSIVDSGACDLSGDSITVLAGQNESGKTAVLSALRDFDLEEGVAPLSKDFLPDGRESKPSVSLEFQVEIDTVVAQLADNGVRLPEAIVEEIRKTGTLWVTRDLTSNKFSVDSELSMLWESADTTDSQTDSAPQAHSEQSENATKTLTPLNVGTALRQLWPMFVYFDSFQDALPRDIPFATLGYVDQSGTKTENTKQKAPQAVQDFISLSGLDLKKVSALAGDNKGLGNYLRGVGAEITGDFLTYWKQSTQGNEKVDLRIKHARNESGELHLHFFVHDGVDQYPDQRSKGFLWFLSFYLRLAAVHKNDRSPRQLLLIDEPGTYLHARAQKDVLCLFEDRLAKRDQILYSTHSIYLMPADRMHRLRLVIKAGENGTKVLDKLTHPLLRKDGEFKDTLSPILASLGLDISEQLSFARPENLLVEGISDHFYVTALARTLRPDLLKRVNIFPGSGATTLPVLASLFVGWGLEFGVLLDRDAEGNRVKDKFVRDFSVTDNRIVQPTDAIAIEDIFSAEDFRKLLRILDPELQLEPSERPTTAIKRHRVDKVLLARGFAENAEALSAEFTKKTKDAAERILDAIESACLPSHAA